MHRFVPRDGCHAFVFKSVRPFRKDFMSTSDTLLQPVRARAVVDGLPYAGAVTPAQAWQLLCENPTAILVDVRTNAERDWVGRVTIPAPQHLAVEWSHYPGAAPNSHFVLELEAMADKSVVILFLCRSGVRSRYAATLATQSGYASCFDILEGFEGDRDSTGHRKTIGGWCYAGLPWTGA